MLRQDASIESITSVWVYCIGPVCYLKAQTAFVIGSHFLKSHDRDDWVIAEQILFECVSCLDKRDHETGEGILSDLGVDALVAFADVLCKITSTCTEFSLMRPLSLRTSY